MMYQYAISNGISNAEYGYDEGRLGKEVWVRGFKRIDGVPATYAAYMYVGQRSMISLYVGGKSETYPQDGLARFLKSVERR